MIISKASYTLTEKGFAHFVVPLLAFVLVGGIGAYVIFAHAQTPIATPADTIYLKSAFAGKCIDDWHDGSTEGTIVDIYGCNNSAAQQWTLKTEKVGDLIENVNGKSCIDNWKAADASNNPIKLYDCNANDTAQLWYVRDNTLENTQTGMCITDPNGNSTDGTNLRLDPCTDAQDQQWTPTPVTATTTPPTTAAPTISTIGSSDLTTTGATITWTTAGQSTTSTVRYGTSTAYGSTATGASGIAHMVTLSKLTADKTYHYSVTSTNTAGKTATSGDYTFTTAKTSTGSGGGGTGAAFTDCDSNPEQNGQTEPNNDVMNLDSGDYQLRGNEWDSSAPLTFCNNGSVAFQIRSSSINQSGGAPGAYTDLYYGCSGSDTDCTTGTKLPMQVSAMVGGGVVTSDYDTTVVNSGTWDDSYDIWFNPQKNAGGNGDFEMMIWLDYKGASPAGNPINGSCSNSTVTIGGISYCVWSGNNNGTISYVMETSRQSVTNLDIGAMAAEAVSANKTKPVYGTDGGVTDSWYLENVETGFEIWNGIPSNGLTVNNFSVTAK